MKSSMIILVLMLMNVSSPAEGQMNGVFCDEVMETILDYQEETGAFSEEQLEDLTGGCIRYEELEAERAEESVAEEVSK